MRNYEKAMNLLMVGALALSNSVLGQSYNLNMTDNYCTASIESSTKANSSFYSIAYSLIKGDKSSVSSDGSNSFLNTRLQWMNTLKVPRLWMSTLPMTMDGLLSTVFYYCFQ